MSYLIHYLSLVGQGVLDLQGFFFLLLFGAAPVAYGSSQARGWIGAVATSLQQCQIRATSATHTTAHSNAGSLTHWSRPGIKPASSWTLDKFVSTEPWRELPEPDGSAQGFSEAAVKMSTRTLVHPCPPQVGMWTGEATKESNMAIPQKIKNRNAFWSSSPTSGYIYKGNVESQRDTCTPIFIAAYSQ